MSQVRFSVTYAFDHFVIFVVFAAVFELHDVQPSIGRIMSIGDASGLF